MARELNATLAGYRKLLEMHDLSAMAKLGRLDLFFLLTCLMRRVDMRHQWALDRCDEVQSAPDGYLDLWARFHFKSSIITCGLTVQDILNDPELTVGIFSHTRPIAKGFLRQIKREFESNELLKVCYPDVLWVKPDKDAPTWSEDSGLVVRRKGNPKESTVEAYGLVDGQPIGKHYGLVVYDDIVTRENALSPVERVKTLDSLRLSFALGKRGGKRRFLGTRYHYQDAYQEVISAGTAMPRIYQAERDGRPVLMTPEELAKVRSDLGSQVYAAQMMLDPKPADGGGFQASHLRYFSGEAKGNTYVVVDPASSKKDYADYTSAWVITLGADLKYYVRWLVRDRLNLKERIDLVMALHRRWRPARVGYERYGMMADVEAIRMEQERQSYRFDVIELGGAVSKPDRISRLLPVVERNDLYLPGEQWTRTKDQDGEVDMVRAFREDEFLAWPYGAHDDMLDALARILDPALGAAFPREDQAAGPVRRAHERRQSLRWVA